MRTLSRRGFCVKKKQFFLSTMLFFGLVCRLSNSFAMERTALSELDFLSSECIQTSSLLACQNALSRAEVLQRKAAINGNYPCQSRLLGLGADLLMISFDSSRGGSALGMLREVRRFCTKF